MAEPYWSDDMCQLFLGDCREVIPELVSQGVRADCMVADVPYGETSLPWDRWPSGWLDAARLATSSLWCFGSLRMFVDHGDEFSAAGWRLSHDVIWRKPYGTSRLADRFRRVHEVAAHWYQGPWGSVYHDAPRVPYHGPDLLGRRGARETSRRHGARETSPHMGAYGDDPWSDDGTRLMPSVLDAPSMRRAIHPTEKPVGLLDPLITYACPPGGLVIDPFAGSGSTLDAARCAGRRAIGIEADEQYIELAARRLSQQAMVTGDG